MTITKTDLLLLRRACKVLGEEADVVERSHSPDWGANAESKAQKRRLDRLRRDERDLNALRLRLKEQLR